VRSGFAAGFGSAFAAFGFDGFSTAAPEEAACQRADHHHPIAKSHDDSVDHREVRIGR